ncbi:MAG: hypothetical protein NZ529_07590 [Cytophagaceae bacterium]|nr:hypothetical protein [Cytophagaceae bacterium]MDW8456647.1 hypothetical protein [Cytophagaceae bacterium]
MSGKTVLNFFSFGRAPLGPGCPPLRYRCGAPLKLRTGLAGHGSHPSRKVLSKFFNSIRRCNPLK